MICAGTVCGLLPTKAMGFRFLLGLTTATLILVGVHSANCAALARSSEGSELFATSPAIGWNNEASGPSNFQELSATGGGGSSFQFAAIPSNDIRLTGYQSTTLAAAPGSTVTLDLQNFLLSGHSTLNLFGDATASFVINVAGKFSLAQSGKILLAGGLQWNRVFFNVLGTGSVITLSGNSILSGQLTASQRIVRLSGHALVYGSLSARQVLLRQSAQVVLPPIVSQ